MWPRGSHHPPGMTRRLGSWVLCSLPVPQQKEELSSLCSRVCRPSQTLRKTAKTKWNRAVVKQGVDQCKHSRQPLTNSDYRLTVRSEARRVPHLIWSLGILVAKCTCQFPYKIPQIARGVGPIYRNPFTISVININSFLQPLLPPSLLTHSSFNHCVSQRHQLMIGPAPTPLHFEHSKSGIVLNISKYFFLLHILLRWFFFFFLRWFLTWNIKR